MAVRILFFASLADITGLRETELAADACPSVGAIFDRFARQFPRLEAHRASLLCAVNDEFASKDAPVRDGDEVAFFPPVSGG